ncbi:hypothetical protein ACM43_11010 [Bradyrhizobium sp. CCBAU 45321]|nr:hypothetical protein [Bradyrhizobium sp. CCBAU 45321]
MCLISHLLQNLTTLDQFPVVAEKAQELSLIGILACADCATSESQMCCSQTHLMRPLAARSLPLDLRPRAAQRKSKPLLEDMHVWLLREREALSRSSDVLKPRNYMLRRGATSTSPVSSTMARSA